MKKIFIGVGHGGSDSGAVKYIVEKEYTLKTAQELQKILKVYGVDSKLSRTTDCDTDLNEKVRDCNAYKPDLVVDIHFNAGGGTGFEVFRSVVGGTSKTLAENINAEVSKIFKSRGVKTKTQSDGRDYFGIIRDTDAPSVLTEGGFVDNSYDAEFIKANYKKLAQCYALGICKTLNISTAVKVEEKILDKTGYKKGDSTIGVLSLKELLLIALKCKLHSCGMDENNSFGDGTQKAVNQLLKKWGYEENGIAGSNFIKKLKAEIINKL